MPRYDEMDDLLRQVRKRLVDETAPAEPSTAEARPLLETLKGDRQYERVLHCTQSLLHDAELLRELLAAEQVYTLSATQLDHVLSTLNSVMQELWASEVTLRRARLHE